MGWQYRKRVHIAPGVDLNINKDSLSISTDVEGVEVTTGTKGTHVSSGGVGHTGLSYSEKLTEKNMENAGNWLQLIGAVILKAFLRK